MPKNPFPQGGVVARQIGLLSLNQSWYCFALLCLLSCIDACGATSVNGAQVGKWTLAGSPYQATQDIYVPSDQTLIIEAGVVVEFSSPQAGFFIDGTLSARGNPQQPILLTSSQTQKSAGQWKGLIFRDPSNDASNSLEYCIIECAGAGGNSENVRVENASPNLVNCIIRNSLMHGLTLFNSDARIEGCEFQNNGVGNVAAYAIAMRTDSFPLFKNNTAKGNANDAIGIFGASISRSGTWVKDILPYTVFEDMLLWSDRTLIIEAGVVMQFSGPDKGLTIDGSLIAKGTTIAPITFTSDKIVKGSGQWKGLLFRDASVDTNNIMEQCIIECGGTGGLSENVRIENASPKLTSCIVRQSAGNGLTLCNSDATINQCQFINNGGTNSNAYAIAMRTDSFPLLKNNSAQGNAHNEIGIFGVNISRSGQWVKDNLPYTVYEDMLIWSDRVLSIEPGVVMQFSGPDKGLTIDGSLIARGTATSPITFTSDKTIKGPGQWKGLLFRDASVDTNNILEQCIIECGGTGGLAENVRIENASPKLTSCIVRQSSGNGVALFNSDATINQCQFINNGGTNSNAYAIAMRTDSFPLLKNNSAQGNAHNEIGIFGVNISRSGQWVKDNLPYTVYEDMLIWSDRILSIEPGVVMQFSGPDKGLTIDGSLIARGTATSPITFTSDKTMKDPGQWKGLLFRDASVDTNNILEQCIIECGGGGGLTENVRLESASPILRYCSVRQSAYHGITLIYSDAIIDQCQFINNGGTNASAYAIAMRTDSFPQLINNTAQGNMHSEIGIFGSSISRSGKWVKDNLPYTVFEDMLIWGDRILTIEPGVVVQFSGPDKGLTIDGSLIARGTATAPITFTSDKMVKGSGQWKGLLFRDASVDTNNILEQCIIECGGAGGLAENVRIENASPKLTLCTVRLSSGNGLALFNSDATINQCQFIDNGGTNANAYAIAMRTDSFPQLQNNSSTGNAHNEISIFGVNISRSGKWAKDAIPYTMIEDSVLWSDRTLLIEPGTIVQFAGPGIGFYIDGTLIAIGSASAPIKFTSDKILKSPGQWKGIMFRDSSNDLSNMLDHCVVEYGGNATEALVWMQSASTRLQNCVVQKSSSDGVRCENSSASPTITACRILANLRDGIVSLNGANPVISGCAIAGNAQYGVRNLDTSKIISARQNYWGDSSGPMDNADLDGLKLLNPLSQGDKVSEYVDWAAFAASDPTGTQIPVSKSALLIIQHFDKTSAALLWPVDAGSFVLQQTMKLNLPSEWSVLNAVPEVIGGSNRVLVATTNVSMMFYRLTEKGATTTNTIPTNTSTSLYVPSFFWQVTDAKTGLTVASGTNDELNASIKTSVYSPQGPADATLILNGKLSVSSIALSSPFEVNCALSRSVQSSLPSLLSSSALGLSFANSSRQVASQVITENPATISLNLLFQPIPQAPSLYKIEQQGNPGFTGGGSPPTTLIAPDAWGGYSGNFSLEGDNGGISTGNGKITFSGSVYLAPDFSSYNPEYNIKATIILRFRLKAGL